jgi:hypothetical protein
VVIDKFGMNESGMNESGFRKGLSCSVLKKMDLFSFGTFL